MAEDNQPVLHKHKHRIRTPLMVFISILCIILLAGGSLFYIQNKTYLQQKVLETGEQTFQVDHLLLKVLLKEREFAQQEVRILNTAIKEQEFSLSIEGVEGIVSIDETSFSLPQQQAKVVVARFSASDTLKGVEHQPGVYAGMFSVEASSKQEIPLIIEIESSQVMFDTNLNPVTLENKVDRGEDFVIEVRLFNLQSIDAENVDMRYAVKDMRGNTLLTEHETVVVKTQASFFKTISIPSSVAPGTYVFIAESRVGSSVGTSSYLFEVVDPNIEQSATLQSFCSNDPLCAGLSMAMLVLLLSVAAYFYLFVGAYFYQKVGKVLSPQAALGRQQEAKQRLEEQKLAQEREAGRAQEHLESEKLAIEKRNQRMNFLKMVLFGRKQESVIKTITKTKAILGINKLLGQGISEIRQDKLRQARSTYEKTLKKYSAMSIGEKKGVYPSITSFYNKLVESENKHHKHEKLQNQQPLLVRLGLVKSAGEREKERKAKEVQMENQREQEELERKRQQAERAKIEQQQKAEQIRKQKEAENQERLRVLEQKRQEEELRKQEFERQKELQKEEQERKKQEDAINEIRTSKAILGVSKLIEQGAAEISEGKLRQARVTYEKTIKSYGALPIEQKKEVYTPITSFYNKLVEAENKHHKHEKLLQQPPLLVRLGLMKSAEEREKQRKLEEAEHRKQQEEQAKLERQHQKELQKQEQARKKEETEKQKREEARRKLIEDEQRKRQAEIEGQEQLRQHQIKEREKAHKERQAEINGIEKDITNLQQQSLEAAQQKGKAMQDISTIAETLPALKGKKLQQSEKKYENLQHHINRLEQKQLAIENSLLNARKTLLKMEGGMVNSIKMFFLPTAYKPKLQKLPPLRHPRQETKKHQEQQEQPSKKEEPKAQEPSHSEQVSLVQRLSQDVLAKKSPSFRKYKKAIAEAEDTANKSDTPHAKSAYLKARELYLKLEYAERTEVYNELNAVYTRLSQ